MSESKWIEHFKNDAVSLHESDQGHGPQFVVMDRGPGGGCQHYRIRIRPDLETQRVSVSIDAEHSDKYPGDLASYTPCYEHSDNECEPGEVVISDEGLLSVMARQPSASSVDFKVGWSAQLPADFVEPVRWALLLAIQTLAKHHGATAR